jgi:hypothetical protein
MEKLFTAHIARWLVPGGILVLVIPAERVADCARTLSYHFTELHAFRLEGPECERYRQVVVFGKAKTRREREKTRDQAISSTQVYLSSLALHLVLPLDAIEVLLAGSAAYRQLAHVLNPKPLAL